jgi:hypothetical protein
MKKMKLFAVIATAVATLALGGTASAQPQGGGGFQNIDPQQIQGLIQQLQTITPQQVQSMAQQFQGMDPQQRQNMMQQFQADPSQIITTIQQTVNQSFREQMGVTNDDEWAVIQERIAAVNKAKTAVSSDGGGLMGMFGGFGGGGGRGGRLANALSPEAQALQQAIDAEAPVSEIKTLFARLQAVHKDKLAKLAQAQADLRVLLTVRQEAIVILAGMMD